MRPWTAFAFVLEAAEITTPPDTRPDGPEFVVGDPEGDQGRQSLTLPRWGGILLVRPGPALVLISGVAGNPPRIRKSHEQLRLM